MNLQQLRYFVTVAELLNFTRAASLLHVTQSGLSKQIADLESKLGVKLFIRSKRYVKLTAAGRELLAEAREIVERSEKLIKKTRQFASGQAGSLKIGFLGISEQNFLPPALKKFQKKFPQIDLSLVQLDWNPVNSALVNGDIDVGFTFSLGLESIPSLAWQTVLPGFLTVAMPQDHPLAGQKTVSLQVLAREPFITFTPNRSSLSINHLMKLCQHHGFSPNIIRQASRMETMLLLIKAGIGIAILSTHVKSLGGEGLCFIEIDSSDKRLDLVVAWKKGNPNPAIPLFLQELKTILPEGPPAGFPAALSKNAPFHAVV
ncbi:MAG: LysR substrate-binding domain-containing protein [Bacillota bacterium]